MLGQNEPSLITSRSQTGKTREQLEIEGITCCKDEGKKMSTCSDEVCTLSEQKSAIKAESSLMENASRASPVPFNKGGIVSETFNATEQETNRQSENIQTSNDGGIQITRKTKVEESLVKSQKIYSAEISASSHALTQVRAASPELEQIMARRQIHQSYHDSLRVTPKTLQIQQRNERCLTPEIENLIDKPHGTWSPMPPACLVRPISPYHIISYPPDIPVPTNVAHPRTATPEQFQEARGTVERFVDHTKHAQPHTASSGKSTQSYIQEDVLSSSTQQFSGQQYTPRYDTSQGFSAYHGKGNSGNSDNHDKTGTGNFNNRNTEKQSIYNTMDYLIQEKNQSGNDQNMDNENVGSRGNSNKGFEEKHTITEPGDFKENNSQKFSTADQRQKSSNKPSSSEEESSQKVFSDFGGPQISSFVETESTTEGGVEKTSVTKSEKMEYSSCEFESSRKSFIKRNDESTDLQSSLGGNEKRSTSTAGESKQYSYPKFSAGKTSNNEEDMVTKSQVEEIIKQELNKVFQMAHNMDTTNFDEIYNLRRQHASSDHYEQTSEQNEQKSTSAQYDDKISFAGEIITKTGKLTTGLTIAPDRAFTPQALESNYPLPYENIPSDFPPPKFHPEPSPAKPDYIALTRDRSSPLLQALTIASERPYSPLPTATLVDTPPFITPPKPKQSSMLDALTTAPSTPFHIQGMSSELAEQESKEVVRTTASRQELAQKYSLISAEKDIKSLSQSVDESKSTNNYICTDQATETCPIKYFPPVTDELKFAFKSNPQVESSSFAEYERQQTEASTRTEKSQHRSLSASRAERSTTPSGLHPPNLLPYYQQNIGEIPLAHRSNSPVPHQIKAPMMDTPSRAQSVPYEGDRRSSVKSMSEAYTKQITALNNQQPPKVCSNTSSVSYVSAGAYSSGSVSKAYSYEQEHQSIDATSYHASPLAGKLPFAGEQTMPKCSSPVLGKLNHTKQVFKPSNHPVVEQPSLRQAPPYFVHEKEEPQAPWVVVKEGNNDESVNISSSKTPQPNLTSYSIPQPTNIPLESYPSVNKTQLTYPEPSKPFSLPGLTKPPSAIPDAGPGGAPKSGSTAGTSAPRRGRGVLNTAVSAGGRIPLCGSCNNQIRGPFITALGKIWCPEHFVCVNAQCRRQLQDIGFVEDAQGLYCEYCFEQYLAPSCSKCNAKVKGDCLNAIGKHFHPECFTCAYCGKLFGNSPFFLEDALPYCETDWNELFTTKCFSCGFPIEAGDRWVEALSNNYHSQCFNCSMCKKNLEGQSFFAKGGRPFCKNHAR